jgi:hypothetical protein
MQNYWSLIFRSKTNVVEILETTNVPKTYNFDVRGVALHNENEEEEKQDQQGIVVQRGGGRRLRKIYHFQH